MGQPLILTTPVGRLVQGSLYNANTTDAEGKPLVTKSGPNMGQARVDYFFALAIPKAPGETHWANTEWGGKIWQKAHEAFPTAGQNPKFAFKITDGDSQIPDGKGRRPCDREGWAGHWIVRFSSGFAPRIVKAENGHYVDVPAGAVKLGYYVQVSCTVDGNGSQQQPGIFINHSIVCFSGHGIEIVVGPDAASAGFGQSPLPAGASAIPLAAAVPLPGMPAVPGAPAPAPLIPGMAMPPVPGAALPPGPGAMPPPVAAPAPAAPAYTMTASANGATREQWNAAGWSDDQLLAAGHMVAAAAPPPSVPAPLPPVGSAPPAPPVAPTVVAPNPAILQVPAGPRFTMTPAANGVTRDQYIGAGWTDAALIQNGLMLQA